MSSSLRRSVACLILALTVASCQKATDGSAPSPSTEAYYAAESPSALSAAPPPMPGDIDRERYPNADPNPVREVATEPVSTFSIDVDTAAYSNVRRFLAQGQLPPRDAVRIEELINYFDYDYRPPAERSRPFEANVSMVPSPWAQGKTLLHVGLQGYDIVQAQRPRLNGAAGKTAPRDSRLPHAGR
jgi:Ca-activated chloride channel family protein